MIKKNKFVRAGGIVKTQILVVEGYRPATGKGVKHRVIKNFGYQEDYEDQEAFWKEVNACNDELRSNKESIVIQTTKKNSSKDNQIYNYGYYFLKAIYDALDLKSFFSKVKFKGNYNLNEIFEFLTLQRILFPDSKRATTARIENLCFREFNFQLADVYNALSVIDRIGDDLQLHIHNKLSKLTDRDTSLVYLDVTNYDTTIDFPEGDEDLRQKGVAKSHTLDPIIQMGLFLDNNSIPLAMSTFPGNTSDSLILQPIMKGVMKNFNILRLIVVADKGLNSLANINYICNNGNGYVFSQILKGLKGKRYHEKLFDEDDYIYNKDRTYKYKMFIEEYTGIDADGNKVTRKRKVLLYWDKASADMEKRKRDAKLAKAEKQTKNNAYGIKKGSQRYIKETHVVNSTGEVAEEKLLYVDNELAELDSKFDGYFCIITSELDFDERKIREIYRQLWKIEETFRVSKGDLLFRPIYVRSNSHIRAHFQICYVGLLISRLFQQSLNEKISIERIQRVLNSCLLDIPAPGSVHLHQVGGSVQYKKYIDKDGKEGYSLEFDNKDEITEDYKMIQESYKINLDYAYIKIEGFNRIIKNIKYMTTK